MTSGQDERRRVLDADQFGDRVVIWRNEIKPGTAGPTGKWEWSVEIDGETLLTFDEWASSEAETRAEATRRLLLLRNALLTRREPSKEALEMARRMELYDDADEPRVAAVLQKLMDERDEARDDALSSTAAAAREAGRAEAAERKLADLTRSVEPLGVRPQSAIGRVVESALQRAEAAEKEAKRWKEVADRANDNYADTIDQREALRDQFEATEKKIAELVSAAQELCSWDWTHLLVDHPDSETLKADAAKLARLVAKYKSVTADTE